MTGTRVRLLIVIFGILWYGQSTLSQDSQVTCVSGSPPLSEYVEAFLIQPQEGTGCVSREVASAPNSGKAVYVIFIEDAAAAASHKKRRQVTLNISPSKDGRKQTILVLSSSQPILWKLYSTGRVKLNIVVSNMTRVHKDGSIVETMTHLPVPTDSDHLMQWVRHQYGGVTAFALAPGNTNTISLKLGDTSSKSVKCVPAAKFKSSIISLNNITSMPYSGCITKSSTPGRDVHVVELLPGAPDEVTVSLRGQRTTVSKHLILVLQSHGHWRQNANGKKTLWHVTTTPDIRGEIDIITEGDVDTSGVTMHTVREVNGERLESYSGSSLVQWATATYAGPPFTYVSTQQANWLKINIVQNSGDYDDEEDSDLYEDEADITDLLVTYSTVSCEDTHMIVSIPKDIMQGIANGNNFLTLLDPLCTAVDNTTHYLLRSGYEQCGSRFLDESTVENAVVLQDERHNRAREALSSRFTCPIPLSIHRSSSSRHSGGGPALAPVYTLKSCDANYEVCGEKVIEMVQTGNRLYVQAELLSGGPYNVLIDNCWVSATHSLAEMPASWLVVRSCKTDATLQWHDAKATASVARFSFVVGQAISSALSSMYVHCRLSMCDTDPNTPVSECKTREQYCIQPTGIQHDAAQTTSISLGPISVEKSGVNQPMAASKCEEERVTTVMGADTPMVIGIAFAAFTIGIIFTGVMWLIHARTGHRKSCTSSTNGGSGGGGRPGIGQYVAASGESTPSSTAPLAVHHLKPVPPVST